MSRALLTLTLALAVAGVARADQAPPPAPFELRAPGDDEGEEPAFDEDEGDDDDGDEFERWDKNHDGVVTLGESDLEPHVFKRMDRDGDQKLTRAELEAFELEEEVSEVFVDHDRDLSGTLGRDEVEDELAEEFARIDVDGDGQISGKELLAFFVEQRRRDDEGGDEAEDAAALVIRAARDAQGETLSGEAFPGSPRLLAAMDADRDGAVTRTEAAAYRKRGVALMEPLWGLEDRAEELDLPREAWGAAFREAEASFEAGRYEDLPALAKRVEERVERARAQAERDAAREAERRSASERTERAGMPRPAPGKSNGGQGEPGRMARPRSRAE